MTITEQSTALVFQYAGKLVDFFGLPVYVPKGYKWVAMDEVGFIFGYTHKPKKTRNSFICSNHPQSRAVHLGQVINYVGNWQHSRMKVKHLPKLKTTVRT